METNSENIFYIKKFAIKHGFKGVAKIVGNTIYLSPSDCPIYLPISIDDIIFDVLSYLPNECFGQWMTYRTVSEISFRDWISSGKFVPDGIDQSVMQQLKEESYGYISSISDTLDSRWKMTDDSDFEDSDFDYEDD